jgi:hypothetical protein
MQKIAQWQDPRSKRNYRLAGSREQFVLEVEGKDAVGDPRWAHNEEFDRVGPNADLTAILGEGLQALAEQLTEAQALLEIAVENLRIAGLMPSKSTVLESPNPTIIIDAPMIHFGKKA